MTKSKLLGGGAIGALAISIAGVVGADIGDDEQLIVNGEIEMIIETAAPEHLQGSLGTIYSGWVFRSDETQEMQSDDFDNPAMIYVDQAMEDFNTVMGSEGNSCASCHTPEDFEMVRATYPQWDEETGERPDRRDAGHRVPDRSHGDGRALRLQQPGDAQHDRADRLGRSRAGCERRHRRPAQSFWEQGREIYYTRFGQLELSCANCHEENYGNYIRADHLSQGQINGFPTYRLKQANLDLGPQPVPRLHPRHPGRDLCRSDPSSWRWSFTSPRAATA
jgi:sulfur-oxidizing protein SoxA